MNFHPRQLANRCSAETSPDQLASSVARGKSWPSSAPLAAVHEQGKIDHCPTGRVTWPERPITVVTTDSWRLAANWNAKHETTIV